jgi:hypothetical protein
MMTTRNIYRALIQLHPADFRARFGGEMMSIFETSSAARPRLIADAALSLSRQWLLRRDYRTEPLPVCEGPLFLLLPEEPALQPWLWMAGFALAIICFVVAGFLISHGGNGGVLTVGSHNSSDSGRRIEAAPAAGKLDTDIDARPAEILDTFTGRAMVGGFYRTIRVLAALDLNHDLVLSAGEIANAPTALRSLDRNHDGVLQEAECVRQRPDLEANPMRSSPALAALDIDHDGILSAKEIARSASSLEVLDKDHNGRLTPEELLSPRQLRQIREALQQ